MTSSVDTEVPRRPQEARAFRNEDLKRRELDELRGYARAALTGFLARDPLDEIRLQCYANIAAAAWDIADAMLVERKTRGGD
jgi:hypothetical protein